jgi:hypothetical protein
MPTVIGRKIWLLGDSFIRDSNSGMIRRPHQELRKCEDSRPRSAYYMICAESGQTMPHHGDFGAHCGDNRARETSQFSILNFLYRPPRESPWKAATDN